MKQIIQLFARLTTKLSIPLAALIVLVTIGAFTFTNDNSNESATVWGFVAHKQINRLAVFTLPPEMFGFYKKNIDYITENAINADQRRYAVKEEAPKHFIDLDNYTDSVRANLSTFSWKEATEKIGENTLYAHGIVPWHINAVKYQLTEAFKKRDIRRILSLSADIGHYIADAHVPLHTTKNYNGQLSNQVGIHGFWESRLPEIFAGNYDFFVGQASYEEFPQKRAWRTVIQANAALDSVLAFEKELSSHFSEDKKYSFEEINGSTTRVYSKDFSSKYHQMLKNQIERQMRASVKMIGDIWFTCWVDAGQPDLSDLKKYEPGKDEAEQEKNEKALWLKRIFDVRKESDN